ncbi:GntR family transcriptional regulator [Paenibacillus sp. CAA11]|uniref:MocR-like pyridoxine biosynthesis transcription factor PdxR n=1 Tax=Paenibacillus sp. CAA11 TaxID=1532905 RepID=UPI000D3BF09B|nr:PLP-dependent aminotransferase family protein [Paenibacillus sp. CAA11]AWB43882.1 GntR family transcriptional regulator [Paenibacillus sp. CAA11]
MANYRLDWVPDKSSSVPVYLQIVEYIKHRIETGEWTVGTRIPSQRKLAELFKVNRSTVVQAFDELIADGLIEGHSGKGTRVKNNLWSLFSEASPPDWNTYVKEGVYQPNQPTLQSIHKVEPLPDIVRLGTGEPSPELFPQEMMSEILHRLPSRIRSLGYEEEKGLLALREQLSIYLNSVGIKATPSSILIVSGALQALQMISLGLLKRGSTLLVEQPSYISSLSVFQSAGIQLQGIPVDSEGMSVSYIQQHKRRLNASLLYTNPTFHNPTGTCMPLARRKQLLQFSEEAQLPVIEDDVYRELWLDQEPPPSLKSLDRSGTVLYLGSFSKALSPGLRIGWVVGPEPVIDRLADIKMQTDYGSSSLSQWAAAEWLSSGLYLAHLNQMRQMLRIRRDTALAALERNFRGIAEWRRPHGGFYIWLRLPSGLVLRELFDAALRQGILINPGNIYDQPSSGSYLRLSYSYASLEDLEWGIERLADIVRSLMKS